MKSNKCSTLTLSYCIKLTHKFFPAIPTTKIYAGVACGVLDDTWVAFDDNHKNQAQAAAQKFIGG